MIEETGGIASFALFVQYLGKRHVGFWGLLAVRKKCHEVAKHLFCLVESPHSLIRTSEQDMNEVASCCRGSRFYVVFKTGGRIGIALRVEFQLCQAGDGFRACGRMHLGLRDFFVNSPCHVRIAFPCDDIAQDESGTWRKLRAWKFIYEPLRKCRCVRISFERYR